MKIKWISHLRLKEQGLVYKKHSVNGHYHGHVISKLMLPCSSQKTYITWNDDMVFYIISSLQNSVTLIFILFKA